jgi:hypothetical protein
LILFRKRFNIKTDEKNIAEAQKLLLKLFESKEELQALISFLNTQKQEEK